MSALYFLNMSKPELIEQLHEWGADFETNSFENMSKRELIAYVYERYHPRMLEVCLVE